MSEEKVSEGFKDRATAKLSDIKFVSRGEGPTILELIKQQEAQKKKDANNGK